MSLDQLMRSTWPQNYGENRVEISRTGAVSLCVDQQVYRIIDEQSGIDLIVTRNDHIASPIGPDHHDDGCWVAEIERQTSGYRFYWFYPYLSQNLNPGISIRLLVLSIGAALMTN